MFSIPPNIIWFMLGIICGSLIFNKKMRDSFFDLTNKILGKKSTSKPTAESNYPKLADGKYIMQNGKLYRLEK